MIILCYDLLDPPPCAPCNVKNLLFLLRPMASDWKLLGETLPLDEDHVDEIYTNNGTEEGCLQEMLERYMMNGDFNHNWEEMATVLRKIGQDTIADRIHNIHVKPCNVFSTCTIISACMYRLQFV